MTRTQRPLQQIGETRHLDEGLAGQPLRIHDLRGRGEHHIDPGRFQRSAILLQSARVVGKILGLVELHRVDEDADHHLLGVAVRLFHQRQVALMQIAHGGHECDGTPFTAPLRDLLTQSGRIVNNQHRQFTFR